MPPFVVMKFSVNIADVKLQQYAIAASLIISGLCTILNCVQIPIPGTYTHTTRNSPPSFSFCP